MLDLLDDVVEPRWDHPFPRTGRSLFCNCGFYDQRVASRNQEGARPPSLTRH